MTASTDRVAVVTGASMGIGAGLAAMLAAEGARVVLAARRADALERAAQSIRQTGGAAVPVVTALADDAALANLVARTRAEFGPIDILVNDAGYAVWKLLEATSLAEWDHTFAENARAAAHLCAAALPEMQVPIRAHQHRQPGRRGLIPRPGGVLRQQARLARPDRSHPRHQPRQRDQSLGRLPRRSLTWPWGYVVPGANPATFLRVDEVVDVVRFLLHTGDKVKLGPGGPLRTMRNPMPA